MLNKVAKFKEEFLTQLDDIFSNEQFILSKYNTLLSKEICDFYGSKYCCLCGSGSDALTLALKCFDLKENDAVLLPNISFFATAESISLLGAKPIFCDVDTNTFCISIESIKENVEYIKNNTHLRFRGIVTVDLFGLMTGYDEIKEICDNNGAFLISDSAQSFGAKYNDRPLTDYVDIMCVSFYPNKPLGCFGDGGACLTNNIDFFNLINLYSNHGKKSDGLHHCFGYSSRMDEVQAAAVLSKLKNLFEDELKHREKEFLSFTKKYEGKLKFQSAVGNRSSYYAVCVVCKDSSEAISLSKQWKKEGYTILPSYKSLLSDLPAYENYEFKEICYNHSLSELLNKMVLVYIDSKYPNKLLWSAIYEKHN